MDLMGSDLTLMFLCRNPRVWFAFFVDLLMCSSHIRLFEISTPRYLAEHSTG